MNTQLSVRLAAPNDCEIIAHHRAGMFRDMGQISPALFERFQSASSVRIRQVLESGDYVGWLASPADHPEKIVAGAGAHLRRALPHPATKDCFAEGRQAVIVNVFTEPEWRRQGIAERLMKEIINWAEEEKLDRLVLHASEHGKKLYERLGFVLTNEMKYVG